MNDQQFKALTQQIADLQADTASFKADTAAFKADTARQFAELNNLILKLYGHTEKRFAQVDANFAELKAELKADIDRVYSLVDQDLKQRETDDQERLVLTHQLDRQQSWITQLAGSTKTKLVPEP